MKGDHIYYRDGYKYVLSQDYTVQTVIKHYSIDTVFISLTPDGVLTIRKDYAWDGASGPTVDTKTSMRGSLVHDALYQLEREGLVSINDRKDADKMLRDICIEDGMMEWRARLWYLSVRLFGGTAADSNIEYPSLTAPE